MPKTNQHKFHPIVRIISMVLIISFVVYDISWAYPDAFQPKAASQNNKLAPYLFTDQRSSQQDFETTANTLAHAKNILANPPAPIESESETVTSVAIQTIKDYPLLPVGIILMAFGIAVNLDWLAVWAVLSGHRDEAKAVGDLEVPRPEALSLMLPLKNVSAAKFGGGQRVDVYDIGRDLLLKVPTSYQIPVYSDDFEDGEAGTYREEDVDYKAYIKPAVEFAKRNLGGIVPPIAEVESFTLNGKPEEWGYVMEKLPQTLGRRLAGLYEDGNDGEIESLRRKFVALQHKLWSRGAWDHDMNVMDNYCVTAGGHIKLIDIDVLSVATDPVKYPYNPTHYLAGREEVWNGLMKKVNSDFLGPILNELSVKEFSMKVNNVDDIIEKIRASLCYPNYGAFFKERLLPNAIEAFDKAGLDTSGRKKLLEGLLGAGRKYGNRAKNPLYDESARMYFYDWLTYYFWENPDSLMPLAALSACGRQF